MDDNSITVNDFYLYEATYFESIDYYGALWPTQDEPEIHRAFIVNGIIFDLDTGQEVKLLSVDNDGKVISKVYTCTPYLITGRLIKIKAEEVSETQETYAFGLPTLSSVAGTSFKASISLSEMKSK